MFKKVSFAVSLFLLTVTGAGAAPQEQADLIALRAEARQLEQQMYELFNALNTNDEFDVACGEKKVTGSVIPEWKCEAAFMRNASARAASNRFDNPGAALANTQGGFIPTSGRQIAFNERKKTQQLNDEMKALARQNAELASAMIAFNDKRQQLEAASK